MTDPCPEREAALAWALRNLLFADTTAMREECERILADLSPAAQALLEKAQAHDAMGAENERLRGLLEWALATTGEARGADEKAWAHEADAALEEPE